MSVARKSLTAREATGFIRGGMLFLEPPHRWRAFDRAIWNCETAPKTMWLCVSCVREFMVAGTPRLCPHCGHGGCLIEEG